MMITGMTATFGCLEKETLTLQPGLNILCRPNEWGKSTWCAFLLAMFYGLDTRAKSTRNALAEKERYSPWSGSPMAGRMDLIWNGRRITLERTTSGRIPMGVHRAYETDSGLAVPELADGRWGETILGVERSVFARAGFIRFADLPVTQDEALRRRLNQLVTTGDESADADRLSGALRDLKNRCRYNQSGLIPKVQSQKEELTRKLRDWESLEQTRQQLSGQQLALEERVNDLQNHAQALRFCAATEDAARIARVRADCDRGQALAEELTRQCAALPSAEQTRRTLAGLRQLSREWDTLQAEAAALPPLPEPPEAPDCFEGLPPEAACRQVQDDTEQWKRAAAPWWLLPLIPGIGMLAAGVVLWRSSGPVIGPILAGCGALLAIFACRLLRKGKKLRDALAARYRSAAPTAWQEAAQTYAEAVRRWEAEDARSRSARESLRQRLAVLRQERDALCDGRTPDAWQHTAELWNQLDETRRDNLTLQNHLQTMLAMAERADPPEKPDTLEYTREETENLLSETQSQLQQTRSLLSQCIGKQAVLGSAESLSDQLAQTDERLRQLNRFRGAVELAQQALAEATAALQRRFAPEITRCARENLSAMTGGRYQTLTLDSDFTLGTGTVQEGVTRSALWRSDGTADQLYLALRLAVAEALTPKAPIVLDDALVRFDDDRLAAAVRLLRTLAEDRQILLFSCGGREERLTAVV